MNAKQEHGMGPFKAFSLREALEFNTAFGTVGGTSQNLTDITVNTTLQNLMRFLCFYPFALGLDSVLKKVNGGRPTVFLWQLCVLPGN